MTAPCIEGNGGGGGGGGGGVKGCWAGNGTHCCCNFCGGGGGVKAGTMGEGLGGPDLKGDGAEAA